MAPPLAFCENNVQLTNSNEVRGAEIPLSEMRSWHLTQEQERISVWTEHTCLDQWLRACINWCLTSNSLLFPISYSYFFLLSAKLFVRVNRTHCPTCLPPSILCPLTSSDSFLPKLHLQKLTVVTWLLSSALCCGPFCGITFFWWFLLIILINLSCHVTQSIHRDFLKDVQSNT